MFGGLRHNQPAAEQVLQQSRQAPQLQQQDTGWGLQRMLAGQPLLAAESRQPSGSAPLQSDMQPQSAFMSQQPPPFVPEPLLLAQQRPDLHAAGTSQQHALEAAAMRRYGKQHSPAARLEFGTLQKQTSSGSGSQQLDLHHQLRHQICQVQQDLQQQARRVTTALQAPSQQQPSAAAQPMPAPYLRQQQQPQQQHFCSGVFADDDEDQEVPPELLLSEQPASLQQTQRSQQMTIHSQQHSAPTVGDIYRHPFATRDGAAAQQHAGQPQLQVYHEHHNPRPCATDSSRGQAMHTLLSPSR
jgi:hypothetical protein